MVSEHRFPTRDFQNSVLDGLALSKSIIYASNLDFSLTNSDLHTLFSSFGKIAQVTGFKDRLTHFSSDVAFILFVSRDAAKFLLFLQRSQWLQRQARSLTATPVEPPSPLYAQQWHLLPPDPQKEPLQTHPLPPDKQTHPDMQTHPLPPSPFPPLPSLHPIEAASTASLLEFPFKTAANASRSLQEFCIRFSTRYQPPRTLIQPPQLIKPLCCTCCPSKQQEFCH